MSEIIGELAPELSEDVRRKVYRTLITTFEDMDWDTQDECLGEDPVFDAVIKELHPNWDLGDD
jgi:hypothetical protein